MLRKLLERRVPQYLALYAGIGWGFLQFMVFLQDTFMLSPEWTKLALFALALLVPSVILFSYFHGRPGRDRWMRLELIAIPVNVLVAMLVLFIEFGGKDLGAQVQTLTVTDESGKTVERTVPKSEYRKRVAVFYFDGLAGDTAKWLQYGVPTAVIADLSQDMFVDLRFGPFFRERLRKAGFATELNVPLPLKREIASDQHLGYIVSGETGLANGRYAAHVQLHESLSSKQLGAWEFTDATPQGLADQISLEVRKALGIPGRHLEESTDLPVAETLTPSIAAFRHYADAQHLMEVSDDYFAANAALERAVAADPTFAFAHYSLYATYLLTNQAGKAMPSLQATLDHLYRLPERVQNLVKFEHYFMTQQQDKAISVAQLNTELYPDDIRSLQLLTQAQVLRDEKDGAIASMRRILALDPQQAELLQQIGQLYRAKGELDSAAHYYSQYAERFPQKRESFVSLGDLRAQGGRFEEAKRSYDKALLLEPNAVAVLVKLGDLERHQGRLGGAEKAYGDALAAARSPEDRGLALGAFQQYHELRGQYRKALEYRTRSAAELAKVQPPFMNAMEELMSLRLVVQAGEAAAAEQRLARLRGELAAPMDLYVPLGELGVAVERGQFQRADSALAASERTIQAMGLRVLAPVPARMRGELLGRQGRWREALAAFEQVLKLDPGQVTVHADIAECHRELGNLAAAEAAANRLLAVRPGDPRGRLELGLALQRRGRAAEARPHLEAALEVWRDADPGHRNAARARAALAQLAAPVRT